MRENGVHCVEKNMLSWPARSRADRMVRDSGASTLRAALTQPWPDRCSPAPHSLQSTCECELHTSDRQVCQNAKVPKLHCCHVRLVRPLASNPTIQSGGGDDDGINDFYLQTYRPVLKRQWIFLCVSSWKATPPQMFQRRHQLATHRPFQLSHSSHLLLTDKLATGGRANVQTNLNNAHLGTQTDELCRNYGDNLVKHTLLMNSKLNKHPVSKAQCPPTSNSRLLGTQ